MSRKFLYNNLVKLVGVARAALGHEKSTVEGHRKALQIAHDLIVLEWAGWEGWLWAAQCCERVCVCCGVMSNP